MYSVCCKTVSNRSSECQDVWYLALKLHRYFFHFMKQIVHNDSLKIEIHLVKLPIILLRFLFIT